MNLSLRTYVACRTPSRRIVYGWIARVNPYHYEVEREDDGSTAVFYECDVRAVSPWESRVTVEFEPPHERAARARRTSHAYEAHTARRRFACSDPILLPR